MCSNSLRDQREDVVYAPIDFERAVTITDHVFIRVLLCLCFTSLISACSRPPELVGIENPEIDAVAQIGVKKQKIFIATTRKATNVTGVFYSGERAPEIGLASVDVTIPPTHEIGKLERPKKLPPDPNTEFSIVDPIVYSSDAAFVSAINRELNSRPPSQRTILFFVHGYNNTTTDSLLRLAQFVEDSEFDGVPVLMSWASAAKTTGYVYDLNSALVARQKLPEIAGILQKTNARSVDVVAHSMGSLLTMEGIVNSVQTGRARGITRVDNIMLASPDIDIDLFRSQMEIIPQSITERIFILTSEDDGALKTSRRVAGGIPRVGASDAQELEEEFGVLVIDLSEIENSDSGSHSKFTGSPEVVQLIGLGLNSASRFGTSAAPPIERILANSPIRVFD